MAYSYTVGIQCFAKRNNKKQIKIKLQFHKENTAFENVKLIYKIFREGRYSWKETHFQFDAEKWIDAIFEPAEFWTLIIPNSI